MTVVKWNEIEHAFTSKFGWYDGLRHIIDASRKATKGERSIYELNDREDFLLIKKLRTMYDKETTWLEKEKVK
tara:strand:- start:67 stop:285 length:219 start_codon:yes stop_codon:yes gene_type:complete